MGVSYFILMAVRDQDIEFAHAAEKAFDLDDHRRP